jgi:hypothetical protein
MLTFSAYIVGANPIFRVKLVVLALMLCFNADFRALFQWATIIVFDLFITKLNQFLLLRLCKLGLLYNQYEIDRNTPLLVGCSLIILQNWTNRPVDYYFVGYIWHAVVNFIWVSISLLPSRLRQSAFTTLFSSIPYNHLTPYTIYLKFVTRNPEKHKPPCY